MARDRLRQAVQLLPVGTTIMLQREPLFGAFASSALATDPLYVHQRIA
jgi:hypothetical protein